MSKNIDSSKNPSPIIIKFANIIFILGILFFVSVAVFASYRIISPMYIRNLESENMQKFYIMIISLCSFSAVLFGLGLKLNNNLKVNLSLFFISIATSVYAFETYMGLSKIEKVETIADRIPINIEKAKNLGIEYDGRTKIEVLKDLNKSGFEAYANFVPKKLIPLNGINTKTGKIYPLGGISNITTILENEFGYYPIIETDEFGYNNPKGLYKKNEVDIMLIGDSFTEGYSVHSNENIQAVLRESNFKTISVGKGGNGPLLELATLKEYGEPLEPKIVLWLYYRNDIQDLMSEMKSSFLIKYLDEDDFSQNLILKQDEIDNVLKKYIKEEYRRYQKKQILKNYSIIERFINILKLSNFRSMINLKAPLPAVEEEIVTHFNNIIEQSEKIVSNWGGKMYFVYLPSYNHYFTGKENEFRKEILATVSKLNIPIIDMHIEVFSFQSEPLSFFPTIFRNGGHYNAEGYHLIAEAIKKRLEADEYQLIN